MAQRLKRLPEMQTWVQSLGWEDPLEKEMATHSSTHAWKIQWIEKPDGPQSMGQQSRTRLSDFTFTFLWIGMKTDLFQSCDHCWVFQFCWHIECSTFIASSFRIWNSSTGIPSPPLALFIVMLRKAHLTAHSRMSGSKWVIISSWLSGSWRSFLYSSSVYSYHLWISSASVSSLFFCPLLCPSLHEIFPWYL